MRKKTYSKNQILSFTFSLLTTSSFAMEATHDNYLENLKNSRNSVPVDSVVIGPESSETGETEESASTISSREVVKPISSGIKPNSSTRSLKEARTKEKLKTPLSKRQEIRVPPLKIGENSFDNNLRNSSTDTPSIKKSKSDISSHEEKSGGLVSSVRKIFTGSKKEKENTKDSEDSSLSIWGQKMSKKTALFEDYEKFQRAHTRTPSEIQTRRDRLSINTVRYASKAIRILVLDGGGVRGLLIALRLRQLEKMTGIPICDMFDIICGTSTGAIIAAALTAPKSKAEPNIPRFTANDLIRLYINEPEKVFVKRLASLNGLSGPKYSGKALEENFHKKLLYEDGTPINWSEHIGNPIALAYNLHLRSPHLFIAKEARADKEKNFATSKVIRAATAASSYFNPATIYNNPSAPPEERSKFELIDAGILVNNPVLHAKDIAEKLYPENDNLIIVSMGTGKYLKPYKASDFQNKGLLEIAPKIFNIALDNGTISRDSMSKIARGSDHIKYYRFDTNLGQENAKLDDTSEDNLRYLQSLGIQEINNDIERYDELSALLSTPKYDPAQPRKSMEKSFDKSRPRVSVTDDRNKPKASLSDDRSKPRVSVTGDRSKPRVSITDDRGKPRVSVSDDNSKPRMSITDDRSRPRASVVNDRSGDRSKQRMAATKEWADEGPNTNMKGIDKRNQLKSIHSKSVHDLSKLTDNQDTSKNVPNISINLGNNAESSNTSENTDEI